MRPKGGQDGTSDLIEEGFQLGGFGPPARPGGARCRHEPRQGGTDDPLPDPAAPAPKGAVRNDLVSRTRLPGPVVGGVDPVGQEVDARLQNRRDGAAPAPQVRRHEGQGRTAAQTDPENRDTEEDGAGGQIGDPLAEAPGDGGGAVRQAAAGATELGRLDQGGGGAVSTKKIQIAGKVQRE